MALKNSDLYSTLWASCDELRGGMDASQYRDYVLFMLFTTKAGNLFTKWRTACVPQLKGFVREGHPKPLIEAIAENLLATFKTAPLLDAKYPKLTEDEIKTLVVDDKWLATLAAAVQGELDRVSQTLTGRIRQLAERYATTLPQLEEQVETLSVRVGRHLKKMGFA